MANFNDIANKVIEERKSSGKQKSDKTIKVLEGLQSYKNQLIDFARNYEIENNKKVKPVVLCEIASNLLVEDEIIKEKEKYEEKVSKLKDPKGKKTEVKLKKWYVTQQNIETLFGDEKNLIYKRPSKVN
jgi:hypothetical protein